MALFFRHYFKLLKKEYSHQKEAILKSIDDKFETYKSDVQNILATQEQTLEAQDSEIIKELKDLKSGVLSVHRKTFMEECRKLIDKDHDITLKEFEDITSEHRIYNSLGGNHEGDSLYQLVKVKYENSLTQDSN